MDTESPETPLLVGVSKESNLEDLILKDQLRTTRLMQSISKLSLGLGIVLFISLTIACITIYYGGIQMQAIVGYHICFFLIGMAVCIHLAYGTESMAALVLSFPLRLASNEKVKERALSKLVWLIGLSLCEITIGAALITGEVLFIRQDLRTSWWNPSKLWISFGIICILTGMVLCSTFSKPKRAFVLASILMAVVSLIGLSIMCQKRVHLHYSYISQGDYKKVNNIFDPFKLNPYPNKVLVLTSLLMSATPPIGIAISTAIIYVALFLISEYKGSSKSLKTNHNPINMYGLLGFILLIAGFCFNLIFNFLEELNYITSKSIALSVIFPFLFAGLVAIGCRSEHRWFGMRLLLLVLSCVLFGTSINATTRLSSNLRSLSYQEQSAYDEQRGIRVNQTFCNIPDIKIEPEKQQPVKLNEFIQSDRYFGNSECNTKAERVCFPSSKICDGYLDYLYFNVTEICYGTMMNRRIRSVAIDEVNCFMTRFYSLFIANCVLLGVAIFISFVLICITSKTIFKDAREAIRKIWASVKETSEKPEEDDSKKGDSMRKHLI